MRYVETAEKAIDTMTSTAIHRCSGRLFKRAVPSTCRLATEDAVRRRAWNYRLSADHTTVVQLSRKL